MFFLHNDYGRASECCDSVERSVRCRVVAQGAFGRGTKTGFGGLASRPLEVVAGVEEKANLMLPLNSEDPPTVYNFSQ